MSTNSNLKVTFAAALMSAFMKTTPDTISLLANKIPSRKSKQTHRAKKESEVSNPLRGYYARYSHAMTEMQLHKKRKHAFSETK